MAMDFDHIDQILELMRRHALVELSIEEDGFRITAKRADGAHLPSTDLPRSADKVEDHQVSGERLKLVVVKAPILGTFYRASGPEASPFVKVGDVVDKGDKLCVIEAMKLMNEIKSDLQGTVVEIFVQNGQTVKHGERLFAIRAM